MNTSPLYGPLRDRDTVLGHEHEVVPAAARACVHVYAIDPRVTGSFNEWLFELTGGNPPAVPSREEFAEHKFR